MQKVSICFDIQKHLKLLCLHPLGHRHTHPFKFLPAIETNWEKIKLLHIANFAPLSYWPTWNLYGVTRPSDITTAPPHCTLPNVILNYTQHMEPTYLTSKSTLQETSDLYLTTTAIVSTPKQEYKTRHEKSDFEKCYAFFLIILPYPMMYKTSGDVQKYHALLQH